MGAAAGADGCKGRGGGMGRVIGSKGHGGDNWSGARTKSGRGPCRDIGGPVPFFCPRLPFLKYLTKVSYEITIINEKN